MAPSPSRAERYKKAIDLLVVKVSQALQCFIESGLRLCYWREVGRCVGGKALQGFALQITSCLLWD